MKKSLIGILTLCLVFASSFSVFAATEYTDVDAHWAKQAIERWSEEDVVNGYEDNTYKPDNNVTRAEFLTMITRLFEPAKEADLSKYNDVDENAWYYEALAKAVEMGIVEGYDNNTLRPNANITRQEAIVILNRVLGLTAEKEASEDKFTDSNKIASWAEEALLAFRQNGYLNGYEDGSVKPTASITRAESAKILDNTIGMIIREAGEYDLSEVKGVVIIKAKDVKITKVGEDVENIVLLNDEVKESLEVSEEVSKELIEDSTVINETEKVEEDKKDEDKKPSSSGGGSSSSTTTSAKITFTTNGDAYRVTKSGTIADGKKLTVIVDGTAVVRNYTCAESTFTAKLQEVLAKLDAEKVMNTLTSKYNENELVREWGMNTVLAMEDGAQTVAMAAAVLGNDDKVDVSVVYDALINYGMTADDIKAKAVEVIPTTFTYTEGMEILKGI